jgi:acyl-CoA hydrolase
MPGETISSEHAASLVRSGMWLDYGVSHCQSDVFNQALAARKDELANVKIRSCLSLRPRAVIKDDPEGKHFHFFSWHFSAYDRRKHDAGRCNYVPLNLGEVPDYYRRFLDPVDIAIFKTWPMDDGGYFNFGPTNITSAP